MRKYVYVRIDIQDNRVWTTNPSVLDWIFNEVKKHIPSCATRYERLGLTGERVQFQLHQLQNKDYDVHEWIVRLLCENGYEPFNVTYTSEQHTTLHYIHFRQMIEE